ncbi:MAG: outer membrane beta-barrel protein [Magnetococcales bacterium]|nr:outer membrane beta-barrel protein [Magnetococcales bacterium]
MAVFALFASVNPGQAEPISDSFTADVMSAYYENEPLAISRSISIGQEPREPQSAWPNPEEDPDTLEPPKLTLGKPEEFSTEEQSFNSQRDDENNREDDGPPEDPWYDIEGLSFSLKSSSHYTDNYFSSETDQKSYFYHVITPKVSLKGDNDVVQFEGVIETEIGIYQTDSADNYQDKKISAKVGTQFSERIGGTVTATTEWGHDDRGSNDDVTDSDTPHLFFKPEIEVELRFGGEESILGLKMTGTLSQLRYLNHESTTSDLELNEAGLKLELTWSRGPERTFLSGIEFKNNDYQSLDKDSMDLFYYVGMDWNPTDLFSIQAKVGLKEKYFTSDTSNTSDFRGLSWNLGVDWRPLDYSTYSLSTSMSTSESTGSADLYSTRDVELSWAHAWNDSISTKLKTKYSWKTSEGATETRQDNEWSQGASINYLIEDWLKMVLEFDRSDLKSNEEKSSYKKNRVVLSLESEL